MTKAQKTVIQAQFDAEKKVIRELEQVYRQALKDVDEKIRRLSMRSDMEPQRIQTIIYQRRFQEAIKAQLEDVLEKLHTQEYATVSEYLEQCYQDGYIGVIYDLQGQGIPLILPIDQEKVTQAIQVDSKLSKSLYDSMGEDVNKLKTSVRAEVSRGIANGSSWNDMAAKIAKGMKHTPFQKAFNRAFNIARTEGHRIQTASALDAQRQAKTAGADVVKQWNSTLDGVTRTTHRMLDGQIRDVEENFEVDGKTASAPGHFGDPAEDCNCRCVLLQRAKWALDKDELKSLQERAEFYGLDKTKDFEEFKQKYLDAIENERSKPKYQYRDTIIDKKVIESSEYRKRFNKVSDSDRANRRAWQLAKEMLEHRSGTRYEDIAFIDYSTGKSMINKGYHKESTAKPNKPMLKMLEKSKPNTIIAIHNHPGSAVPSIPDLRVCTQRNYKKGIVVCHDGKIYAYSVNKEKYNEPIAASALDWLETEGYTDKVKKAFSDAGVTMEVF